MLEYSIFSYVTEAAPTLSLFFFFNDTATTEIYTLSLHDALPISVDRLVDEQEVADQQRVLHAGRGNAERLDQVGARSEEHTSELQSQSNLVCRLLLEKKKNKHVSQDLLVAPTRDLHRTALTTLLY